MTTIFARKEFCEKLEEMGYSPDEKGFLKCIKEHIKEYTLNGLARELGITNLTISSRMKKYGIKNPNKAGGKNNPYGFYGKEGTRRDITKGRRWKDIE